MKTKLCIPTCVILTLLLIGPGIVRAQLAIRESGQYQYAVDYSIIKDPMRIGDTNYMNITVRDKTTDQPIPDVLVLLTIEPPNSDPSIDKTTQTTHTDKDGHATFTVQIGPQSDAGVYNTNLEIKKDNYNSTVSKAFSVVNAPSGYTGIDWSGKCQLVQVALTQSCDMLVNPDGSLSDQGRHAMNCIRNGALLGSGAKLIGIPTGIILGGLRMLAGPTGCDDVVNADALKGISGLGSIISFLP